MAKKRQRGTGRAGGRRRRRRAESGVARVIEISARSSRSFEEAIQIGITRVNKTMRNVTSAWVKEQRIEIKNGKPVSYQVNMLITFVLED